MTIDLIWAISLPVLFLVVMRLWYGRVHTLALSRENKGLVNWVEFNLGNRFRYSGVLGFVYLVLRNLALSKAGQKNHHDTIFTQPEYEYIRHQEKYIRPL